MRKAREIFQNIYLSEETTETKENAIRKIINMETHNSFTKQEFINALDWLLNEHNKVVTEFTKKLIGRLEEELMQANKDMQISELYEDVQAYGGKYLAFEKSLKIVNQLAKEYINSSTNTSTSNADKIRAMSDEELAEWLHNISHDNEAEEPNICIYDLDKEKEIELYDSYGDLLEWLKSSFN